MGAPAQPGVHPAAGAGHVSRANQPLGAKEIESTIGYDFSGPFGTVVANRGYEVAAGELFEKRYKIRVPIFA